MVVFGIDSTAPFNSASLRRDLASCFNTAYVSTSTLSDNVGIQYIERIFICRAFMFGC